MRGYGWGRDRQLALDSFPIYKKSYKDVEFLDQLSSDVNIHHHGVLVQTKKHSYTISEISDFIQIFCVSTNVLFSVPGFNPEYHTVFNFTVFNLSAYISIWTLSYVQ